MKRRLHRLAPAAAAFALLFASCGGSGGGGTVPVASVSLDKNTLAMTVGAQEALSAAVLPADASIKNVSWQSSRTSVATVSAGGLVKAVGGGSATITATTKDGGKTAACAVTVAVPVTGVSLWPSTMELVFGQYGSTAKMAQATVQPDNATDKGVTWTSSNKDVAGVGGASEFVAINGNIAGTAVITVTTSDGGKTATCAVTVTAQNPLGGVALSQYSMPLGAGQQAWLNANIGAATDRSVTWASSDAAVATVAADGLRATVRGASVGTATVTVTTREGGRTASCLVTVTDGPDIYAAGSHRSNAAIWDRGALRYLGNGISGASANSVFVSGGDVYVAGDGYASSQSRAVLWKNGVPQVLSDSESSANSVQVSGGDVYVAGYENYGGAPRATVWKDGAPQRLGSHSSWAYSVRVQGGDVYAAGCEYDGGGYRATVWKNGEARRISDSDSQVASLFVSGGDVYIAGYTDDNEYRAMLWKNGVPQALSGEASLAHSVFVSGGDVYVAGREPDRAMLWKNGVGQRLSSVGSQANSVFVLGGGVFVVGEMAGVSNYRTATVWKDGATLRLSQGMSSALSVFVK